MLKVRISGLPAEWGDEEFQKLYDSIFQAIRLNRILASALLVFTEKDWLLMLPPDRWAKGLGNEVFFEIFMPSHEPFPFLFECSLAELVGKAIYVLLPQSIIEGEMVGCTTPHTRGSWTSKSITSGG